MEWLRTPDLGTGMLENRERVRFGELRRARRARVFAAMREHGLDACLFGRESNARYTCGVRRLWTAQSRPFSPTCVVVRDTEAVHLLSFSASVEGLPEELRPDDVFRLADRHRQHSGLVAQHGRHRVGSSNNL